MRKFTLQTTVLCIILIAVAFVGGYYVGHFVCAKQSIQKLYEQADALFTKKDKTLEDRRQAFFYYKLAAEGGLTEAQYSLGLCYLRQDGTGENEEEAFKWFRKAVHAEDDMTALSRLQQAAEKGNKKAQYIFGFYYRYGKGGIVQDGGVVQGDETAFNWYEKAAEAGLSYAQNTVGFCYSNGIGVSVNDEMALHWYYIAADNGDTWAINNIGVCYSNGEGGLHKDKKTALDWFRKAADSGNALAMSNIGTYYEYGEGGIRKDEQRALEWHRMAADNGNARGMRNVGIFYEYGKGGLTKDYYEAQQWYQKANERRYSGIQEDLDRISAKLKK